MKANIIKIIQDFENRFNYVILTISKISLSVMIVFKEIKMFYIYVLRGVREKWDQTNWEIEISFLHSKISYRVDIFWLRGIDTNTWDHNFPSKHCFKMIFEKECVHGLTLSISSFFCKVPFKDNGGKQGS